jgi:hypothetical protein
MTNLEKIVKIHGAEVANVTIPYTIKQRSRPDKEMSEEFDAAENHEIMKP